MCIVSLNLQFTYLEHKIFIYEIECKEHIVPNKTLCTEIHTKFLQQMHLNLANLEYYGCWVAYNLLLH